MGSFLTGIGCAALLAAGTLWVLEAGTITMVERSNDLSTVIDNIWAGGAQGFPDAEDTQ
jgi:hypothetical protein